MEDYTYIMLPAAMARPVRPSEAKRSMPGASIDLQEVKLVQKHHNLSQLLIMMPEHPLWKVHDFSAPIKFLLRHTGLYLQMSFWKIQ